MLGRARAGSRDALGAIGFVAQDAPLYPTLTVADTVRLASNLSDRFDVADARARLAGLDIPLRQKVGKLSGGQHTQVALAITLARHPELLVLDEPVARLDPLARHEFMAALMAAVAEGGLSVLLSSHVVAELEQVCDYLVLLSAGSVQVAGAVEDLLTGHRVLTGPAAEADAMAARVPVVADRRGSRQVRLLASSAPAVLPPGWQAEPTSWRNWCSATSAPRRPVRSRGRDPRSRPGRWRRDRGGNHDPGRRPARRRPAVTGIPWITWRQHRAALGGLGALFGALTVLLVGTGLPMHRDWTRLGLGTCPDPTAGACRAAYTIFSTRWEAWAQFLPRFLLFLPLVVGVFLGAPMLARELESGTFRFAWTQGRGRSRWTAGKLLLLGPAVTLLALAFSAAFAWWYGPWSVLMGRMASGQAYEVLGVVFAARTLFAFTLGAALGAVIRRTVPAMAATAAVWLAVAWPSVLWLRPRLRPPLAVPESSLSSARQDWTISSCTRTPPATTSPTASSSTSPARPPASATARASPSGWPTTATRPGPPTNPTPASGTSRPSRPARTPSWPSLSARRPWPGSAATPPDPGRGRSSPDSGRTSG